MKIPKTIRQIYHDETGKDAEIATPLEGFELAVYVEAPSKDYIDWLERRASRIGGSANTSTNTGSPKLLDLLKLIEFNIRNGFYDTALDRVNQAVEQLRAGA